MGGSTPEGVVLAEVVAFCKKVPGLRVFRNHSGRTRQGYRYGVGPEEGGGSDLIGWYTRRVLHVSEGLTPLGIFVAIEVKAPKEKATPEQAAFLDEVRNAGGIAGVVHSAEECAALLGADINETEAV